MIQLILIITAIASVGLIAYSLKKKSEIAEVQRGIIIDGIESLVEKRLNRKAPPTSISFGDMPDALKMQIFQRYGFY